MWVCIDHVVLGVGEAVVYDQPVVILSLNPRLCAQVNLSGEMEVFQAHSLVKLTTGMHSQMTHSTTEDLGSSNY
jgi:hypothetical protein